MVVKKRAQVVHLLCRNVKYGKYEGKQIGIYDKDPEEKGAQCLFDIPDVEGWAPFIKGLPENFKKDTVVVGILEFTPRKSNASKTRRGAS